MQNLVVKSFSVEILEFILVTCSNNGICFFHCFCFFPSSSNSSSQSIGKNQNITIGLKAQNKAHDRFENVQ